jgi:hypothetical protein
MARQLLRQVAGETSPLQRGFVCPGRPSHARRLALTFLVSGRPFRLCGKSSLSPGRWSGIFFPGWCANLPLRRNFLATAQVASLTLWLSSALLGTLDTQPHPHCSPGPQLSRGSFLCPEP